MRLVDCERCASELLEAEDRSGFLFWLCVWCQLEYLRFGERWVQQAPRAFRNGTMVRWRKRVRG